VKTVAPPSHPGESTFDAIAALLPAERREPYYRRMAHLRNLEPEDEMLQIAEAMGYLALLIREAPGEVSRERVQLGKLLEAALAGMQSCQRATAEYHQNLDGRLKTLPSEIAKGISPQAIASTIRESLRQQFAETGMQYTADELNVLSERMRTSSKELTDSLGKFSDPKNGALERLSSAVARMELELNSAAKYVRSASEGLCGEVKWSILWLNIAWLVVGFVLGILFWRWKVS
jgi:hypothetical protein